MSFLSKNGAGILVCLLISIVSWYLGGFFPVIGAPVFAIFMGMLLHPFLSSYKQLDVGLTFSLSVGVLPLQRQRLLSMLRKRK
ncbi:membrane protein [Streptococcus pneumoniae]|nr:membrane protein [Streptococcus pneumoniae]